MKNKSVEPSAAKASSSATFAQKVTSAEVAIVGMACRFPGGSNSPESFWDTLTSGRDCIRNIPNTRWDVRRFHDANVEAPGKIYVSQAGIIDGIELFDPLFFGFSPREAESLDPQQRLLLQVTWEALERAGMPAQSLAGSRTGVMVGAFGLDAFLGHEDSRSGPIAGGHVATSSTMTMLAARIAHAFDLRGPAMSLDTACSSSLVAAHYAYRSLLAGDCDIALVAGANVILSPTWHTTMCKAKFLSPTGRCHTFDASADGYVRAEGAGCVVLKPLANALRDGDHVHAVILASGVNQDGHTPGITLPSSEAQLELVRRVYSHAGVRGCELDYVEAHGTGTQAGDLAEVRSLDAVLSEGREGRPQCPVGSLKSNMGHMEAAAGVAALIKAALVLEHAEVPPNLHFVTPNPALELDRRSIRVPTAVEPLPRKEDVEAHLVGVNSFGYGGTNAHALLSSAPAQQHAAAESSWSGPFLFPVSASAQDGLRAATRQLARFVADSKASLGDIGYTAARRRTHHKHRLPILAESRSDLVAKLNHFAETGTVETGPASGSTLSSTRTVFVYSGMGPQWWAMGQGLYASSSTFKAAVDECDALFSEIAGWSIRAEMLAVQASSRMHETRVAQPANFVLQYGLTRLLQEWGVTPDAVVGHSVGEVTASWASGILDLRSALRVSYQRSRLQQTLAGTGVMVAVELSREEAEALTKDYDGRVCVAAVNGPDAVTLAGDEPAVRELHATLSANGVNAKILRVEVPYHSHFMEPIESELKAALVDLPQREAHTAIYSTVTGRLEASLQMNAAYWWRNVRETVNYAGAVRELVAAGYDRFVEVGPNPVLSGYVAQIARAEDKTVVTVPTLQRSTDEHAAMLGAAAALWRSGLGLAWQHLLPVQGRLTELPIAGPSLERCWSDTPVAQWHQGPSRGVWLYEELAGQDRAWRVDLCSGLFPWLGEHRLGDSVVLPGAAYIDAALELGFRLTERGEVGGPVLRDIRLKTMLTVDPRHPRYLTTQLDARTHELEIRSDDGSASASVVHCIAQLGFGTGPAPEGSPLNVLQNTLDEQDVERLYESLAGLGLNYGPLFRTVKRLYASKDRLLVRLEAAAAPGASHGHHLHPALLDGAFQAAVTLAPSSAATAYVPSHVERVTLYGAVPLHSWADIRVVQRTDSALTISIRMLDDMGHVLAVIDRVTCSAIALLSATGEREKPALFSTQWVECMRESGETRAPSAPIAFTIVGPAETTAPVGKLLSEAGFEAREVDAARLSGTLMPSSAARWIVVYTGGMSTVTRDTPAVEAELTQRIVEFGALVGQLSVLGVEARLCLLTRGGALTGDEVGAAEVNLAAGALVGLCRVARTELESVEVNSVDLDPHADLSSDVLSALLTESYGRELALRKGKWFEQRLAARDFPEASRFATVSLGERNVELEQPVASSLEALRWREIPRRSPEASEIEVRTLQSSVVFKDLLKVTGQIAPDATRGTFFGRSLGMMATGRVSRVGPAVREFSPGDLVLWAVPEGTLRAYATFVPDMAVKVAKDFGTGEPGMVAAFTAHRALIDVARLRAGETVLIHNAAGAVGLYALQIARRLGARAFVTASTQVKRARLLELGAEAAFDSQGLAFGAQVREASGGRGVDVVLAAVYGDQLRESFAALGPGGRYVDIGKRDIVENRALSMAPFQRSLMYCGLDVDVLSAEKPETMKALITEVAKGFSDGVYKKIEVRTYPAREVHTALRAIADRERIGAVALSFEDETVETPDEVRIRSDGTYLVTGGLRGFGLEVAKWIGERRPGALVLISRSGEVSPDAQEVIRAIRANGTKVTTAAVDVSQEQALRGLLSIIREELPPLKGIFHAAMVLDDRPVQAMDPAAYHTVVAPKLGGALLLDRLTRGDALEIFFLFSSVSALVGNRSQANYAAANAGLDALALARRNAGLPATSISWGALAEVGVVARNQAVRAILEAGGIIPVRMQPALAMLERALSSGLAHAGIFAIDWSLFASENPKAKQTAMLRQLVSDTSKGSEKHFQVVAELVALDGVERSGLILERLKLALSHVARIPVDAIDVTRKLTDVGVDSLMSVEFGIAVDKELGVKVGTAVIVDGRSLAQLALWIEEELLSRVKQSAEGATKVTEHGTTVEQLNAWIESVQARMGG
jgi:acyl transferase domain-containing protein/NADPH:quinone reductase-like Zn-dependent oxidoreductase/short-subunit dehydrogenase involved in D-alanine esterification of teichoic acids